MIEIKFLRMGILVLLLVALVTVVPLALADDSPAMGGANWNAVGTEWQMEGSAVVGSNVQSEVWTYWINGTDSNKTVGPGEQTVGGNYCPPSGEFSCPAYEETGQSVYVGLSLMDKMMYRTAHGTNVETWSPMIIYLDRQTLEPRERWQKSGAILGETWSKVWNINAAGVPADRDLNGGETWHYNETTDPASAGWGNTSDWFGQDAGNQNNELYNVSVSNTPQDITVAGMTFSCYEVDKLGPRGHIYDYWDVDGALAGPVKTIDELSFDQTNTLTLRYHDWPGAPMVTMCNNAGTPKTDWTATPGDNVYVTGHWVTLNPSLGDGTPNQYDIWIGQGAPSEGDVLGTDWGTDTGMDANVAPQAGANVPGTFFVNLGPAQNLPVNGPGLYIILDEGDGIYHLDNQTFELEGYNFDDIDSLANCPACYVEGDTAFDDGLSNAFELSGGLLVETLPATGVTPNNATLNGNLTDMGGAATVDVSFEYGIVQGGPYPFEVVAAESPMNNPGAFHADITSLNPGQRYYFRASGDYGAAYGLERFLDTPATTTVWIDAPLGAEQGTYFTATVRIDNVTNFDSSIYDVNFDGSVLQLNNVTGGMIGANGIPVDTYTNLGPGAYRIDQNIPGNPGVTGSGYLAELHFSVPGALSGNTNINLANGNLWNNMGAVIPAVWNGDIVTISSRSVTVDDFKVTPTLEEWKEAGWNMPMANKVSRYEITFTLTNEGELEGGVDEIHITFPNEMQLPTSIDPSNVLVNGVNCGNDNFDGDAAISNKTLKIVVPQNIPDGAVCTVIIMQSAGIANPKLSQELIPPGNQNGYPATYDPAMNLHLDRATDELYQLKVATTSDPINASREFQVFDWMEMEKNQMGMIEFPFGGMVIVNGAGFMPDATVTLNGLSGGPLAGSGKVSSDGTVAIYGFASGAPPFVPLEGTDGSGRASNWVWPMYSLNTDQIDENSNKYSAEGVWHLLPSLSLSANSGLAGSQIIIEGTNWTGTPTAVYPQDITIGGMPLPVEETPVMVDKDHDSSFLQAFQGVELNTGKDDFSVKAQIPRNLKGGKYEIVVTGGDTMRCLPASVAGNNGWACGNSFDCFNDSINRIAAGLPPLGICADGGTAVVRATFTVLPRTVKVEPSNAAPGSTVTLKGEGFVAGEPDNFNGGAGFAHNLGGIAVYKYGNSIKTETITTNIEVDDQGGFTAVGKIPADATEGNGEVIVFFDPTDTFYDGEGDLDEVSAKAAFAPASRGLTVIPSSGPLGTTITVSGGNFGSAAGGVIPRLEVNYFEDPGLPTLEPLSTAGQMVPETFEVDADEGFRYGDDNMIRVIAPCGGIDLTAACTFDVTRPTLQLDKTRGPRGTLVKVSGSGWQTSGLNFVTIAYRGNGAIDDATVAVVEPNGNGDIAAQFRIPSFDDADMGGGEANLIFTATDGENDSLQSIFTVTGPHISVKPESAAGGEVITVHGEGFLPQSQVQEISLANAPIVPIYELKLTDAQGAFEITGTVPGVMPGGYAINARVNQNEGAEITCPFTVVSGGVGDVSVEEGFASIGKNAEGGQYLFTKVWTFDSKTKEWLVYDIAEGAPDQFDTLVTGQGYWVEVTADCTLTYSSYTYDLINGWNLIGWQG